MIIVLTIFIVHLYTFHLFFLCVKHSKHNICKNDNAILFFQPVYLKCDIMNNAGIVDRVDCACKLDRVPPKTQNPLHALLGDRLCVDTDECCISVINPTVPDCTLLGKTKISPTPSSSTLLNDCEYGVVPLKQDSFESHSKRNKSFNCRFLRKKISDKNDTNKSTFPVSSCVCKTHKWKFPMIMQKAWKHNRRVRLKSIPSINNMPLQRYQSHHSSSDEDWFEEIADDDINNLDEKTKTKCNSDLNTTLTNADSFSSIFDAESNQIETEKLKWCSFAFRKCCNKPPLTKSKISRKNPKNMCQII